MAKIFLRFTFFLCMLENNELCLAFNVHINYIKVRSKKQWKNSSLPIILLRKDFIFQKAFTVFFVITMYVSGGLIPSYILISRNLHLNNNFLVYIVPGLISVYNVILVRSYIDGLPDALEEAANIDGANDLRIWASIVMPLCKPVLATVALFIAVGQWNSFMDTYLYAKNLPTLQYILYKIMQQAQMKIDP